VDDASTADDVWINWSQWPSGGRSARGLERMGMGSRRRHSVVVGGRARTANERIEWQLEAARGRLATRSLQALRTPVDLADGWGGMTTSTWDRRTRTGYELDISFAPDHLGSEQQPAGPAMPASEDGVVIDLVVTVRGTELRVLGIASAAFPPEQWEDEDSPDLPGRFTLLALHSEELWLGVFAPEPG